MSALRLQEKALMKEAVAHARPVAAAADELEEYEVLFKFMSETKPATASDECSLLGPGGRRISLPTSLFFVLERVAEVMSRGDAVTVVPVHKELTTQQAADLLNVSRQYLVRLLDQNEIPHSKTGKHRRVRFDDLMAFKNRRDAKRKKALDELAAESEEIGYAEFD